MITSPSQMKMSNFLLKMVSFTARKRRASHQNSRKNNPMTMSTSSLIQNSQRAYRKTQRWRSQWGRRHRRLQDRRVRNHSTRYHPCHIGEVLISRYVLVQKLGWGHFSTVWLAKDFKYNNYVAVKIMKSSPHYLEASYDEVSIIITKTGWDPAKSGQLCLSSRVD